MVKKSDVIWVVVCESASGGCEHCDDTYHIVGAFTSEDKASDKAVDHESLDHAHQFDVQVHGCVLDEVRKEIGIKN